jgi:hypothetical protein
MENLLTEIKNYLCDKLDDYKGTTVYACDLSITLTEGENANCSVYCNAYETKEMIKANFELFGDFLEYYNNNFGEMLNPFLEPEKTHVVFLIESCSQILSECKYINDKWDKKIELTDNVIKKLKKHIKEYTELSF